MAKLLKGAPVAAAINEALTENVEYLLSMGIQPTLAIVRVGARSDDIAYEKAAMKRCDAVGVAVKSCCLPEDIAQDALLAVIEQINGDKAIHGALLFRPLPKHLDDEAVRAALSPAKDVDGITDGSLVGVFAGTEAGFPPCTAQACMEILHFYGYELKGKRAVVVGRSLVVGKPVAMMLLQANATVTICHTRTLDMPAVCREAEVVIVAAGRAGIVDERFLCEGQVVIDVGINVDEAGKLCGDVAFDRAEPVVGAITPVPGGVGTVTTSVLVKHVVDAALRAGAAE